MELSFGARLRAQRERQDISLTTIAEQTKIRLYLLEDLEQDNIARWPHGIFRRSYLRTYAHAIGLDAESTVREFLDLYPDPIDETPAALIAAQTGGTPDLTARPSSRLHFMIDSAINALPQILRPAGKDSAASIAREVAVPAVRVNDQVDPVDDSPDLPEPSIRLSERITPERRTPDPQEVRPAAPSPRVMPRVVPPTSIDLQGMASLCTQLAQVQLVNEVPPLLHDASRALAAEGLILWVWDQGRGSLWPSLSHGYPSDLLAQLPKVRHDSDNAIAAAFRAGEARIVPSRDESTGAFVAPMFGPSGCVGVMALEFRDRREQDPTIQAFATILTAQLSSLIEGPSQTVMRSATA